MAFTWCSLRRKETDLRALCGKNSLPRGQGSQGVEMGANQNRLMSEQRTQGTGG